MIDRHRSLVALLIAFAATAAFAQERVAHAAGEHQRPELGRQEQNAPGVLSLLPGDAITEHSIDTSQGKLAYTATAGTLSLFDQLGERSAAVFYTAYVAKSNDPVGGAWRIALGRSPEAEERERAQDYLRRNGNNLERLCLLLFNMSEFLYVN